jgi:hypothetical protein
MVICKTFGVQYDISDSIGVVRLQYPVNGFQILFEYNLHHAKCKYCRGGHSPDLKFVGQILLV